MVNNYELKARHFIPIKGPINYARENSEEGTLNGKLENFEKNFPDLHF